MLFRSDKVDQEKLLQVLRRLGIAEDTYKLIEAMYKDPKFKVSKEEQESDYLQQQAGIRQGCPLSPYLFVLAMSAIFSDIKDRLHTHRQQEPIDGITFSEVLYADDTIQMSTDTKVIN